MAPEQEQSSILTPEVIDRMKLDLYYLVRKHCHSVKIGDFKAELFLHASSRIEYKILDIHSTERFISLVDKYWHYFAQLISALSVEEQTKFFESSSTLISAGIVDIERTRVARLANRTNRMVVTGINIRSASIPENILLVATILGINLQSTMLLRHTEEGSLREDVTDKHRADLRRIAQFSSYLLKDKLLITLLGFYLQDFGSIERVFVPLTLRINAGKAKPKYFPLLNFIRLWKSFEWMLSEKSSLYDVLTRTLDSIGPDRLYELWVFYKTLDALGPMKQNFKNRSLFSNGRGIEVEYHWQQEIGWLLERANGYLTEVRRFPDVIVRKNGKDVLVIDAKCVRYSDIMPDNKQEPGPPRDIVNQMIIYLDFGKKKDLGMVLFADDIPREQIVVKQADSRKIIFLNCYPYSDNSNVVFGSLRNYTESCV